MKTFSDATDLHASQRSRRQRSFARWSGRLQVLAMLGCVFGTACDVRDDGSVGLPQGDEPRPGVAGALADVSGGETVDDAATTMVDDADSIDGVDAAKLADTHEEDAVAPLVDILSTNDVVSVPRPEDDDSATADTTAENTDVGPEPPVAMCGDGVINQHNEACDGLDLGGATCADLAPDRPEGQPSCTSACVLTLSDCRARDADGDLVPDDRDPFPNDFRRCGDSDNDGCDDCSVRGISDPSNDGFDSNQDGRCELPLDWDCMNGANAAADPYRLEACIVFSHTNRDRAHFAEEAGQAGPVTWNEDLWVVARAHSLDMCARGFFAHTDPDGRTPGDRAVAAGIGFSPAENIAANLDPGAAQYGWMHRPTCRGHRGAILDKRATEAAIGYVKCADFASPANYAWREHHLVTGLFRVAWGQAKSAFCQNAATECEIPPNPPTTAPCPAQLRQWGFCPTPSAATLQGWNCPLD